MMTVINNKCICFFLTCMGSCAEYVCQYV